MKESKEQTSNFPDLSKINVWFLLPIAVLMSELLTLLFSEIYSLLFFGTHLQMEFVLIGMWDSGLVSLIAVGFIIFIMDRYHKLRENYISLYEENKSRKEFTEKLNISEKRYRAIYEQAALGIFNLDKNGRFLQSNKRFCDMLGYTEEELSRMTYLDVTHDDDKAISSSAFEAMSNEI
nr:PAS domain S-box protein [Clostridia bacterium]